MTYCLAIKVNDGIVFASDSRTNAGVDYVSTYSKMHTFQTPGERLFVLLTAGNLATTQAVVNRLQRDMEDPQAQESLARVGHLYDAAHYVGRVSTQVQAEHAEAMQAGGINPEANFLLGGQIGSQPHEIFMIYPQGNYIGASPVSPYLQVGETKYGKPILDRIVSAATTLEDAARCALVSIDSTMRSNLSVGPPVELAIYRSGALAVERRLSLQLASPLWVELQKRWNEGLRKAFTRLPRFDWE